MQSINVNIVPGNFPQILRYSQGDVGREFRINVVDFDIPAGATVTIVATKPSGFGFTAAGTVTDNVVSFVTTEDMTDEYGKFPAEVRITSGTTLLGTANFMFIGEKNPHPDGTVDGMQGTIIPELTLLVNEIRESNAKVESMTASAVALPTAELSAPTVQGVQEWFNDNETYIYWVTATPTPIYCDPTEIRTLKGNNNVWADTGDVEVEYRADTTLAFEKLKNAIVSLGGNI